MRDLTKHDGLCRTCGRPLGGDEHEVDGVPGVFHLECLPGQAMAQGEPVAVAVAVAYGRVIGGKAVTISLERTPANDEPLYAAPVSSHETLPVSDIVSSWEHGYAAGRRDQLKAAPPPEPAKAEAVVVKPLEWSRNSPPDEKCHYDHIIAEGAWAYRIEWKSWKKYDSYCIYRDEEFMASENDLSAAKAAAQSDYEHRILSALTTKQEA